MTKRLLLVGNWKMNRPPAGFDGAESPFRPRADIDVVVCPTVLDMPVCLKAGLIVGAQCGHPEDKGARTGDMSIAMLKEAGCHFVLCGHSDRRSHHGETDAFVRQQVIAALEHGVHPILCVGETEEEHNGGTTREVLQRQLKDVPEGITIAYEPCWAIGSGHTPTPKEIGDIHAFIRTIVPKNTRILYGGSVNPTNALGILRHAEVNGALIGGTSLKPKDFAEVIEIAVGIAAA
jgi:triosephosphate isomerase